ncbi:hypothetical protein FFF34_010030 [Inquilinus sp. KBS0705]|nr:hypothetical protein FFF34_010030 [Inquilinus sp. KBS0705]
MNKFIDITDRPAMRKAFTGLSADTQPVWGKMKPQQMVEHMIDQVEYTNGKKIPTLDVSPGDAAKSKQLWIYTDAEIPRNVFVKALDEVYRYPTLSRAIEQVFIELDDFDAYLKPPGTTAIHGGFGPMNHKEWVIWHGKHFTHHLKQFSLI